MNTNQIQIYTVLSFDTHITRPKNEVVALQYGILSCLQTAYEIERGLGRFVCYYLNWIQKESSREVGN